MPTYDFRCNQCQHRFSQFVALKDKDRVTCPQCQSQDVSQLFTGFLYNKPGGGSVGTGGGCTSGNCGSCAGC